MAEVNVLKFDCNNYLANLSLAKSCLDEYCFLKAIGYMRQAISVDPSRPEAFNLLGACCEMFRRPLEAQKFYRAALVLEPAYGPAQRNLHRLVSYHKRGRVDFGAL